MQPISLSVVVAVGVYGLLIGSLLARCVSRLGLEKSVFWPWRPHCDRCYQPVPFHHRIPVLGYLFCLGRCRACGSRVRIRGVVIELVTMGLLVGLFVEYSGIDRGRFQIDPMFNLSYDKDRIRVLYAYHALLFCFLVVATFIDLELMIIPDSVTVTGMVTGLVLGTFVYVELHPITLWRQTPQSAQELVSTESFARWVAAVALDPDRLDPARQWINNHYNNNWNWWLGFSTGLVGLLIGGGFVLTIRAVLTWVFRREAMGAGDATLMAMVGAFLGWQATILIFFLAIPTAALVGILGWLFHGKGELPHGPHLSIAAVALVFWWKPIWWSVWRYFDFDWWQLLLGGAVMLALLVAVATAVGTIKRLFLGIAGRSAA